MTVGNILGIFNQIQKNWFNEKINTSDIKIRVYRGLNTKKKFC